MIDINKLLYEICETKEVFNDEFDLLESETLDSYSVIELFNALEQNNINLYPTEIDKEMLRTPGNIKKMINDYLKK